MLQVRVLWPPFCAGFSHSSGCFSSAACSCPLCGYDPWHRSARDWPRASGAPFFFAACGWPVGWVPVPPRTTRESLVRLGAEAWSSAAVGTCLLTFCGTGVTRVGRGSAYGLVGYYWGRRLL